MQRALEYRAHLFAQLRRQPAMAAQHEDQTLVTHQAIELHGAEAAGLCPDREADSILLRGLAAVGLKPHPALEISVSPRPGPHSPSGRGLSGAERASRR